MRWESTNSESILESANVESARDKKRTRRKVGYEEGQLGQQPRLALLAVAPPAGGFVFYPNMQARV